MRVKVNHKVINRKRKEREALLRQRQTIPSSVVQSRIILPPVINTVWNLQIPKILHVYWDSSLLPHIRYMTVNTFMRLNPDWKIILWTPQYPNLGKVWKTREHGYHLQCSDKWEDLLKLPITVNKVDFTKYGLSNDLAEVHKSDFLRTHLLSTMGGVWSDMDILYFNPIINLRVNNKDNRNIDTFVCISYYGHSTGFMMASPNNNFFKTMFALSLKEYNPDQYQCIGPVLYNKYGKSIDSINKMSSAINIDMESVYWYDGHNIPELMSLGDPILLPNAVGIHWYAGYNKWGRFLNETDGGRINLPPTIIGNLLKKLNNEQ